MEETALAMPNVLNFSVQLLFKTFIASNTYLTDLLKFMKTHTHTDLHVVSILSV